MTYRIFISDTLFYINNSVANYVGGSAMKERYYDIIKPKKVETRTPEDIIEGLKSKLQEI